MTSEIKAVLLDPIFWKTLIAGIILAIGAYFPEIKPICDIIFGALGVHIVIDGMSQVSGTKA